MTQHPELFAALAAPFDPSEVKERDGRNGQRFKYVTARTVMNRLDDVLGPENWQDDYTETRDGLKCTITVTLPDGREVRKSDGGGSAGMADGDDDEKSAFSSAFKRAAVKFGVGRYFYRDGVPAFVRATLAQAGEQPSAPSHDATPRRQSTRRPEVGHDLPPPLPPTRVNGKPHDGPPRTGRALFAWVKDQEQAYEVGLLKYLNGWGKLQDFPGRMVDWDADQVALGLSEARRKLESLQTAEAAV